MNRAELETLAQANALVRDALLHGDDQPGILSDAELEQFEWLTAKIEMELTARIMLVDLIEGDAA